MSALQFGVESGSQKILNLMEKKYQVDEIIEKLLMCAKLQVHSPIPIVLGMPGETEETVKKSGEFIGKMAAKIGCHPEVIGLLPLYVLPLAGTPLYEYGQQVGVFGKEPEEVDKYLMEISGSSIYKRYYYNLNGAPKREVIFWDWLLRLEASRTYRRLRKTVRQIAPETTREVFIKMHEKEVINNPHYNLRFKYIRFNFITKFVENHVIGNKYIDKINKDILYPFIKWFGYFEFLVQSLFPSNRVHPIFRDSFKLKRLDGEDLLNAQNAYKSKRSPRGKSLRGVVLANNLKNNEMTYFCPSAYTHV